MGVNLLKIVTLVMEGLTHVLRRIFGHKRDTVMEKWRKLPSGELQNLYSSPDIIRQVKSRRMRWAGHVARMGFGEKARRKKTTWKTKA
jgi:hypothetical protein